MHVVHTKVEITITNSAARHLNGVTCHMAVCWAMEDVLLVIHAIQ